jgi:hypothetical protein
MNCKKKFELLANIMRASHFEWRRAALAACPGIEPGELVKRYWAEVGKDTARFYLKKIDPDKDLAPQMAELFVSSSVAMGEEAEVVAAPDGESQVVHHDCPWYHWHKREGAEEEDQPGCDHWLQTIVDRINESLGRSLRFETLESLPGGAGCCRRRFWEE